MCYTLTLRFTRDSLVQDVKDSIKYVLKETGQTHLTYVGHSQGTLIGFTLLMDPEIVSIINLFVGTNNPQTYVLSICYDTT